MVAQVFLAAKGYDLLGKQNVAFLEQKKLTGLIPGIREPFQKYPDKMLTPVDVAVEVWWKEKEIAVDNLPTDYPIQDIGVKTIENYGALIRAAKSIVFSGPMGVYEKREMALGTKAVFEEISRSGAFTLAGGGHTISALQEFGLTDRISYVSTAGGALVEFLMGKRLPGVVALEAAAERTACSQGVGLRGRRVLPST